MLSNLGVVVMTMRMPVLLEVAVKVLKVQMTLATTNPMFVWNQCRPVTLPRCQTVIRSWQRLRQKLRRVKKIAGLTVRKQKTRKVRCSGSKLNEITAVQWKAVFHTNHSGCDGDCGRSTGNHIDGCCILLLLALSCVSHRVFSLVDCQSCAHLWKSGFGSS